MTKYSPLQLNYYLLKIAKIVLPPKTLQIIECVDVIKSVTMVSLRQHSGLGASFEQPPHQFDNIEVTFVVQVGQESLKKLFAEGVCHLEDGTLLHSRP